MWDLVFWISQFSQDREGASGGGVKGFTASGRDLLTLTVLFKSEGHRPWSENEAE